MERRFLTTTEAARVLGLERWRVWDMCVRGQIPAIKVGRRFLVDGDALGRLGEEQAAERRKAAGK